MERGSRMRQSQIWHPSPRLPWMMQRARAPRHLQSSYYAPCATGHRFILHFFFFFSFGRLQPFSTDRRRGNLVHGLSALRCFMPRDNAPFKIISNECSAQKFVTASRIMRPWPLLIFITLQGLMPRARNTARRSDVCAIPLKSHVNYDRTDYRYERRRFARKLSIIYTSYSAVYENINENWTSASLLIFVDSVPKYATRQITRIHCIAAVDEQISTLLVRRGNLNKIVNEFCSVETTPFS